MTPVPARRLPLLAFALAAALALAGARPVAAAQEAAGGACGVDCEPAAYSAPNFEACLRELVEAPGAAARAAFPANADFDSARRTWNSRTLRAPAAVFYARSPADVAGAVACAAAWGVRVSPAAGRHGLTGAAAQDGALLLDVSGLSDFTFAADNSTVTVGAGASAAQLHAAVHDSGIPAVVVPTGICPFVGMGGYTLGGGLGLLGRYAGLACDSLVGVELVLANGTLVEANSTHNSDLLWASCGGGGGTFGVATALTFKLTRLPNRGRVTVVDIRYATGVEPSVQGWLAFQKALQGGLDRHFGFFFWFNQVPGVSQLRLEGVFLGAPGEALELLEGAGMLQGLDGDAVFTAEQSDVVERFSAGVRLQELPDFYSLYKESMPLWTDPILGLSPPWGRAFNASNPEHEEYLAKLMRGQDGLRVVVGGGYGVWFTGVHRVTGALPEAAVRALVRGLADFGRPYQPVLNGHVLGGAYEDRAPDATAFPHRGGGALFVLDHTVSLPNDLLGELPVAVLEAAASEGRQFLRVLAEHLPPSDLARAYVNYQLPHMASWREAYWGANYPRLAALKAAVDPLEVFAKPHTVQGAAGAAP